MADKGFLNCIRQGCIFVYIPKVTHDEYIVFLVTSYFIQSISSPRLPLPEPFREYNTGVKVLLPETIPAESLQSPAEEVAIRQEKEKAEAPQQ